MTQMAAFSNSAGTFVFSLANNSALSTIDTVSGTGFQQTALLNGKPRVDFVGGQLERKQLRGVCYPEDYGNSLAELFTLKDSNMPVVYSQAGKNRGLWAIKQVSTQESEIMPNGQGLKIAFTVSIEEFPNE